MDTYYRFMLGQFSCVAISDGGLNYPIESFFKGIDPDRAKMILHAHQLPTHHVYTPYTLLFIDTGSSKVLIDTGIGQSAAAAEKMFPTVDNSTIPCGTLVKNMQFAGISPDEIDMVIITHAHPDHIGNTLTAHGDLTFPKAQYVIWKDEWEFWFSDTCTAQTPLAFVTLARTYLEPLRDRITLVDHEEAIVPGISAIATPGHTPGHICVQVRSEDHTLIHLSDALLHPLHLEYPDITPVFDLLPEQAHASKQRICARAIADDALVFAHHFPPFPNLGSIIRQHDGWLWQSLQRRG